jgi:DNA-binding NtrC family response regulator
VWYNDWGPVRLRGAQANQGFQRKSSSGYDYSISGYGDHDYSDETRGTCEYIHKPIDINELEMIVDRMKETLSLSQRYERLTEINGDYKVNNIIGKSNAMKEVFKIIGPVSESKTSILIQGESGTGKELIAKVIITAFLRASPSSP